MTHALCHIVVMEKQTTNIRALKHDTARVLERVAAGETLVVTRRGKVLAVLSPPDEAEAPGGGWPSLIQEIQHQRKLAGIGISDRPNSVVEERRKRDALVR